MARLTAGRVRHLSHRGYAWVVGPVLVGLVAVFMALASERISALNSSMRIIFPIAPLFLMPSGFAMIAYLSRRWFPGTSGSGIPQTIAALEQPDLQKSGRLLSLRIAIGKMVLTLAGLLVGASIGREGPTVQIGASIMHLFYGRGPFRSAESRRILILAGGAAGIAAAFNTPLAGIMFAIEALAKKHVFTANSSTLITMVFAGLISLFFLGNYTYFGSTTVSLDLESGVLAVLVCGLVGGLLGGVFSRAMIVVSSGLPGLIGTWIRRYPLRFAALCGLGVALIGLMTDSIVFGTGYQPTRMTLEDHVMLPWYFGVAKMGATLLSSISGIPGGLFAPSLAVGAGIGDNIAALLPGLAPHSAIIILVMAAYLSGVTREPMTSFIIMMEMTGSHPMLLPLMATTVLASAASKLVCPKPLYETLAERFALAPTLQPAVQVPINLP